MNDSRIRKSDTLGALFAAMARVQAEVTDPFKGSENPHFRSRYADLVTTIQSNRKVAAKYQISIMQFPFVDGGNAGSTILISHPGVEGRGEWIESDFALPMPKVTPQGGGSAVTYARRYQTQGVLFIAPSSAEVEATPDPAPTRPEEIDDFDPGDDDGEAAEAGGDGQFTDEKLSNQFTAEKIERMREFDNLEALTAWAGSLVGIIRNPSTRAALRGEYKRCRDALRSADR